MEILQFQNASFRGKILQPQNLKRRVTPTFDKILKNKVIFFCFFKVVEPPNLLNKPHQAALGNTTRLWLVDQEVLSPKLCEEDIDQLTTKKITENS